MKPLFKSSNSLVRIGFGPLAKNCVEYLFAWTEVPCFENQHTAGYSSFSVRNYNSMTWIGTVAWQNKFPQWSCEDIRRINSANFFFFFFLILGYISESLSRYPIQ